MKKLITVILILTLILPATAAYGADLYVSSKYSTFVDAELYNAFFNAGFNFDSQLIDLIIMSDFKTAYYSKEEWANGQRITTGMVKCDYAATSGKFTITFPNGEVFDGYYDDNGEDVWLNLGGAYFRLCPVHYFDISKDFKDVGR